MHVEDKRWCDGKSPCWHCLHKPITGERHASCKYVFPDGSALRYKTQPFLNQQEKESAAGTIAKEGIESGENPFTLAPDETEVESNLEARRNVFATFERDREEYGGDITLNTQWMKDLFDIEPETPVVAAVTTSTATDFCFELDSNQASDEGDIDDNITDGESRSVESFEQSLDTARSGELAHARAELSLVFPAGFQIIPTSGEGNLCGLNAILTSMTAQMPDLEPPTLENLTEVLKTEEWAEVIREFSADDVDVSNTNNFTIDQVGRILHIWTSSQGLAPIQLGVVVAGAYPFIIQVPSQDEQARTLWIHNNNATELLDSPTVMNHYSGLRANQELQPEVVNVCLNGENDYVFAAGTEPDQSDSFTPPPPSWRAAMKSKNAAKWKAAAQDEFASLVENDTWVVLQKKDVPKGRNILTAKWVFKKKLDSGNEIVRYKARWVARGFEQIQGQDFSETFASVVKGVTYRIGFALATQFGMHCHLMDVKTAFLNGVLDEEVYLSPPEGFESSFPPRAVLKLVKSLYGLKQSPRQWYQCLREFLISLGWKVSEYDQAVFFNNGIIIEVYVDDLKITGKDLNRIGHLKETLSKRFKMTDLGECRSYLGMTVARSQEGIYLHHARYIEEILNRFGLRDTRKYATPMEPSSRLETEKNATAEPAFRKIYQEMVGCLNYVASSLRFDIALPTGILSRFLNNPNESHMNAAVRIFGYLHGTNMLGLLFSSNAMGGLEAYVDSDWGGCPETLRSTTGWIVLLGGSVISWSSKRQSVVALSTCEAEYMAAAEAVKEIIWIRWLLEELGFPQTGPTTLHMDNEAAIKLTKNPEYHARSKHIALRFHHLREKVLDGTIAPRYVPTKQNIADMLTKPLARPQMVIFRDKVSVQFMGATKGST